MGLSGGCYIFAGGRPRGQVCTPPRLFFGSLDQGMRSPRCSWGLVQLFEREHALDGVFSAVARDRCPNDYCRTAAATTRSGRFRRDSGLRQNFQLRTSDRGDTPGEKDSPSKWKSRGQQSRMNGSDACGRCAQSRRGLVARPVVSDRGRRRRAHQWQSGGVRQRGLKIIGIR